MLNSVFDCEVLIVGAGPVGLATALSLLAQCVNVRIIDDMPVRHATPRASSIHARTLELLAPFGVSDRLVAYAQPIRQTLFFDVQGQEILRRQLRAIDSQYPAQQSLQQGHAEWMIAEQLLARGVDVQATTRCTDLVQNAEGIVVTVESDAGTSALRCRYLVGADGARSTVRKLCDVRMVGEDYPERWIVGELVIEHTGVLTDTHILFGPDRPALTFPLDGAIMFFTILRAGELPEAQPGPANPDHVLQMYYATFGAYPRLAHRVPDVPWSGHFLMHKCCLFDGFNWTLILTVPDRTAVRTAYIRQLDLAALVWLNARVRIVLTVGDAFAWNAHRPTLYVVRPDGYIAFRCDAAAGQLPDVNRLSAWLIENFAGSLRTDSVAP